MLRDVTVIDSENTKSSIQKPAILMMTEAFSPNIGGLETHLDDLCRYVTKENFRVFVATYQPLTTKKRALSKEIRDNLEIHRVRWFGQNWRHKLDIFQPLLFAYLFPGIFLMGLRLLLKNKREIGVIHAHGLAPALAAKILGKLFGKRLVMSTHTVYGLRPRSVRAIIFRWILSSFDTILPLAQISKDELVAIGLQESRIEVYTHWVNLDTFKPLDRARYKSEFNWEKQFTALFVGRLIQKKGGDVLLQAATMVHPAICFAFIGDGPLAKQVSEAAESLANVIYLGPIPNEEIPNYCNAADVFVIPSQYEEGFGRVVAEALACGLPVIASNRGTLPEIITSDVGKVFEMSAENLASNLVYLYNHQNELAYMQDNCRQYALDHFSDKNAEVITSAYLGDANTTVSATRDAFN